MTNEPDYDAWAAAVEADDTPVDEGLGLSGPAARFYARAAFIAAAETPEERAEFLGAIARPSSTTAAPPHGSRDAHAAAGPGFDVEERWPDLFSGLDAWQRRAVVQSLATEWHEGWEPNREDVANLTDLVRGVIDRAEYMRRVRAAGGVRGSNARPAGKSRAPERQRDQTTLG